MKNTPTRTEFLGIRLSTAERLAVEKAAAADRRSLSDWSRLALVRVARARTRRRAA